MVDRVKIFEKEGCTREEKETLFRLPKTGEKNKAKGAGI